MPSQASMPLGFCRRSSMLKDSGSDFRSQQAISSFPLYQNKRWSDPLGLDHSPRGSLQPQGEEGNWIRHMSQSILFILLCSSDLSSAQSGCRPGAAALNRCNPSQNIPAVRTAPVLPLPEPERRPPPPAHHAPGFRVQRSRKNSFRCVRLSDAKQAVIQTHFGSDRVHAADPMNIAFDFVGIRAFGAGLTVWKILAMYGNDCALRIFFYAGAFNNKAITQTHAMTRE